MGFVDKVHHGHSLSDDEWNKLPFPPHDPDTLLIACVDARMPIGEIGFPMEKTLINREIAALVTHDRSDRADMPATLEFAVKAKKVKRIVVMGHTDCGGIHASMAKLPHLPYVEKYVEPLRETRDAVEERGTGDAAGNARMLEQDAVRLGLKNLRSYDFIRDAEAAGELELEGRLLDIRMDDRNNKVFRMYMLDEGKDVFFEHSRSVKCPEIRHVT